MLTENCEILPYINSFSHNNEVWNSGLVLDTLPRGSGTVCAANWQLNLLATCSQRQLGVSHHIHILASEHTGIVPHTSLWWYHGFKRPFIVSCGGTCARTVKLLSKHRARNCHRSIWSTLLVESHTQTWWSFLNRRLVPYHVTGACWIALSGA